MAHPGTLKRYSALTIITIAIVKMTIIDSTIPTLTCRQVGELMEGSLRAVRLYPGSVNSPRTNSSQRDAKTAVDAVQNIVREYMYYMEIENGNLDLLLAPVL